MRLDLLRMYWRRPDFWRWWWRDTVGRSTKRSLMGTLAVGLGIAGFMTADRLSDTEQTATFATERVVTVVRTLSGDLPRAPNSRRAPEVVTMTTIEPGETDVVTVGRDRAVVVRDPGETVTKEVTVRGPVREHVVTERKVDEVVRTETVDRVRTTPGATETVIRQVTEPARTVEVPVTRQVTVTDTVRDEVTVTDRITVRDEVTVTEEVTVKDEVTVTEEVTVTVTVKR